MRHRLSFLLIGALCLIGCTNNTVIYDQKLDFKKTDTIASVTLDSAFFFAMPRQIVVADSLLIIQDTYKRDTCFHLFCDDGRYLRSFGLKGKGPGELLEPAGITVNDSMLYVYDATLNKIVSYDLWELVQGKPIRFRERNLAPTPIQKPGNYTMLLKMFGYDPADSSFLFQGNDAHLRFGNLSITDNAARALYAEYPTVVESGNPDENMAVWSYTAPIRISPNGRHIVHGTYIGGLLETFDRQGDKLIHRALRAIYPPLYRVISGIVPTAVSWDAATIIGFEDIAVTDSYIYGLLNGSEGDGYLYPQRICLFDWDGNGVRSYETDRPLAILAVDESKHRIYALTHEAAPRLILLDINNL